MILAGVALFAGCMFVGTKVDPGSVANLRKGETTYDQAIHTLGTPNQQVVNADGTRTVIYYYAKASPRAADFVPMVNLLAGGADAQTSITVLRFDQRGILVDATTSQGQTGASYGLLDSAQ